MQMNRLFIGALSLICASSVALADIQSGKGVATVSYEKKVTPDIKAQAFHQAEVNALDRYYAESGTSQSANFEIIKAKVSENLDNYILGATVISEEDRPDARSYTVVVRVDINASKLNLELKRSSVVGNTSEQQKSPLTFVFVARAQDSVKSFDAHVYKRTDVSASADATQQDNKSGTEGEKIGHSQISTNASTFEHVSVQANASGTVETGGSTTLKANQVTWTLIPSANLNSIVTGVFGSEGYDLVEAEYVEPQSNGLLSLQALQNDYKTGNDLQPITLRNTVQGLQAAQVPYLALATLDVGFPGVDPQTGLPIVYVTVTGKILDVTGRFPRTLASVGPEQFAGTGPSTDVAQTNALKLAADKAAHELVSQVNAIGVH